MLKSAIFAQGRQHHPALDQGLDQKETGIVTELFEELVLRFRIALERFITNVNGRMGPGTLR